jgi:hypothetical protein
MYMHMSGLRDRAIAASMAAWIDEGDRDEGAGARTTVFVCV